MPRVDDRWCGWTWIEALNHGVVCTEYCQLHWSYRADVWTLLLASSWMNGPAEIYSDNFAVVHAFNGSQEACIRACKEGAEMDDAVMGKLITKIPTMFRNKIHAA